jgi:hypothetical protein
MERNELRNFEQRLGFWAEDLRFACLTFRRTSPDAVRAVTVADRLRSDADQPLFLALVNRLRDEYHVAAAVELNGRSFAVRLTRCADGDDTPAVSVRRTVPEETARKTTTTPGAAGQPSALTGVGGGE